MMTSLFKARCEISQERVAANGRPLRRGGVSRNQGFSPSTRVGCSRTGPERLILQRTCTLFIAIIAAVVAATAQPGAAAIGKDVTVLGFKLHYLEAGRGAPVVLLHGLGGDGSRWGP